MSKASSSSQGSLTCGLDKAAKENVPTTIVVFGASGDLAKKKTFPALFHLFQRGLLPKRIGIIGYARTKMTSEEFHKRATSHFGAEVNQDDVAGFLKLCTYVSGKYDVPEDFKKLREEIENHE
ncbi:Glucose-6-phosphate 1-dehydrogenase, partial [Coemansia sp. RSA 2702]